jgi:hypothetical protein
MLYAKSCTRATELRHGEEDSDLAGSIRKAAMRVLGFDSKEEITKAAVDPMVKAIESAILDPEDEAHAMIPEEGGI